MPAEGPIAIYGAGAFGTALACVLAAGGKRVRLCARNPERAAEIAALRANDRHLPGIGLDPSIGIGDAAGLEGSDLVLMAVPAQAMREAARQVAPRLAARARLVSCAKGIERGTGRLMSEVLAEELPDHPAAVLSGPGFADEIAAGLPTAMTLAAGDDAFAGDLAARLSTPRFRLYTSTDMAGVQWGGALKNVMAIAAGIVAGRRLGKSAEAALITRGFAELQRMASAFGAEPRTLTGLSGLGDLILTCSSRKSRNYAHGMALGRDETGGTSLVEGAATAHIAARLAEAWSIDAPVTQATAAILSGNRQIDSAIGDLLSRPLRREHG